MQGAMRGLADGLDPDSAYLSPDQVKEVEAGKALPAGDVGVELTRQYYLRIIAARDGSPAAKAGLRSGDYVRTIDDKPTREMSVWEGTRALRGAPGSKVTLIDHPRQRRRPARGRAHPRHHAGLRGQQPHRGTGRRLRARRGYRTDTAGQVKSQIADLQKNGAAKLIVDVRRTSTGDADQGLALARLFVNQGTLAIRERSASVKEPIAAGIGDGAIKLPVLAAVGCRNVGRGGAVRVGDVGQPARGARRRAHDRPRRHPEADQAARQQRPVAVHGALPHPCRRAAARKGTGTRRFQSTSRMSSSDRRRRPGDPTLDKAIERLSVKQAA